MGMNCGKPTGSVQNLDLNPWDLNPLDPGIDLGSATGTWIWEANYLSMTNAD